jgi:prepilin-type N-terminal cleavage/methylation domain-containing protein
MKKQAGFTLIELLVVIAIIAILASTILASLTKAQDRAANTAVQADFHSARTQTEIYYVGNNSSYAGVCDALKTDVPGGVKDMMADATAKLGAAYTLDTALSTAGSPTQVECHSTASGWAFSAPIRGSAGNYWCQDWTGNLQQTVSVLASNYVTCQ